MVTDWIKDDREEGSEEAFGPLACSSVCSRLTQGVLEEDRVWRERVLSWTHSKGEKPLRGLGGKAKDTAGV